MPSLPIPASRRRGSEAREVLRSCLKPALAVAIFSFCINILLLVSPIYMLQVYDRVLRSRSESTLLALTFVTVGLLAVMAALELIRSRVLVRMATRIDSLLGGRIFMVLCERQLRSPGGSRSQPLNDLGTLRQFVASGGLFALFDLPWTPIFLIFLFLVHPLLGLIASTGALLILLLMAAGEVLTRRRLELADVEHTAGMTFSETSIRSAEALHAMGMLPAVTQRWQERHGRAQALQAKAADFSTGLAAFGKLLRIALQTTMMGAGALLAIRGQISAGMMIAASIVGSKALAPIETVVSNWSAIVSVRLAYRRLDALLRQAPPDHPRMELPPPQGRISVEGVVAVPPGSSEPVLRKISFEVNPGEAIGIIGPSAAGKSTLARILVGAWAPQAGTVRIDGVDLQTWPRDRLGSHVGYVPQDIEMLTGTVGENIARFGEVDGVAVVEAARKAGVHEMILRLPEGYDTQVGEGGVGLSGGQRQRLALARALYGNPALYILDEPNSNLDTEGDALLLETLRQLRAEGRTVIVIAHRPNTLAHVDRLLVLKEGQIAAYGPKAEVLPTVTRPALTAVSPASSA